MSARRRGVRVLSGQPTVHRCESCGCRFALLDETKPGHLRCPSCGKDDAIAAVDVVAELGGSIAKKLVDWWKSLPTE